MKIEKYKSALKDMDRGQLLSEFLAVLSQQEEIWAGKRDAIDYPVDGAERPEHRKSTVANPPRPEYLGELKRKPDGSAYYVKK